MGHCKRQANFLTNVGRHFTVSKERRITDSPGTDGNSDLAGDQLATDSGLLQLCSVTVNSDREY